MAQAGIVVGACDCSHGPTCTGFSFDHVRKNPSLWSERLHEEDRPHAMAALEARTKTGRFSVEYHRRFGESPSDTLRRRRRIRATQIN